MVSVLAQVSAQPCLLLILYRRDYLLAAKGAVLLGGGIVGAISAAFADEAEKHSYRRAGSCSAQNLEGARKVGVEGTMLGLSLSRPRGQQVKHTS